jgi:hypothetical protein
MSSFATWQARAKAALILIRPPVAGARWIRMNTHASSDDPHSKAIRCVSLSVASVLQPGRTVL